MYTYIYVHIPLSSPRRLVQHHTLFPPAAPTSGGSGGVSGRGGDAVSLGVFLVVSEAFGDCGTKILALDVYIYICIYM